MAEFSFDSEKHIIIAGKVYERDEMSDEIKAAISHINFSDQELATMEQNLRVYRVGRDAMVSTLLERLETENLAVVAVVPDPPTPEEAQPPAPEAAKPKATKKRETVAAK